MFDSTSVQTIKFETLTLKGNYLKTIDLTKVGGHASYKIRISNPNDFPMNLTKIGFTKDTTSGNYYFTNKAESDSKYDNCLQQAWYHSDVAGANLNMPANGSCSLYTTSLWLGPEQASFTDSINYTVANPGFGFEVKRDQKINLWCQHDCSPVGGSSGFGDPVTDNRVNFSSNVLTPSKNEILNAIPLKGFALAGDYLFTAGTTTPNQLRFTRYQLSFANNQLNLMGSNLITFNFIKPTIPSYTGFATRKDGMFITYTFKIPTEPLLDVSGTIFQAADSISTGHISMTGQEPTTGLQGLDNELWWNSATAIPYYQTYQTTYPLALLNQLSANLPASNSTILGVDPDGNMVIKTGSRISCYSKQTDYIPVPQPAYSSTFSTLADALISSKSLYTNHATLAEKYYDFNGRLLSSNLYYPIDAQLCQAMPRALDGTVPYLVVPNGETLIISDKYTAIKTNNSYVFAATTVTSDGSNNIKE